MKIILWFKQCVHLAWIHRRDITMWMVLVCYVTVSRCKQCVCMLCTSCLNYFTEILSCKSLCKYNVYNHYSDISLQIRLCTRCLNTSQRYVTVSRCKQCVCMLYTSCLNYFTEISSCKCCWKYFSRWWNDFYVSWKVKVKSKWIDGDLISLWLFGEHENHFHFEKIFWTVLTELIT